MRSLHGHKKVAYTDELCSQLGWLARLPVALRGGESDIYGSGPLMTHFEERMASLLGHEAAVFFPSGVAATLAAARVHMARIASTDAGRVFRDRGWVF
jgi:7-keto-8-aminopelargonate synthetase-like enzyme